MEDKTRYWGSEGMTMTIGRRMGAATRRLGQPGRAKLAVALVGVAALLLSACGATSDPSEPAEPVVASSSTASAAPVPPAPDAKAPAAQVLPAVQVREITGGQEVDLATLTVAGKPTLIWAWAPHCPYCNAEAPKVNEFAENNEGVTVVGVGTQDSFAQAEDFVAKHDLRTPTMVWDESFESWQVMQINSMPTFILVSANGDMLLRVAGQFPEEQITSLL